MKRKTAGHYIRRVSAFLLIIFGVAAGCAYWFLSHSRVAELGRTYGYEKSSYALIRTLQDRASRHGDISSTEMFMVKVLLRHEDFRVRGRALSVLSSLGMSERAKEAADLAIGHVSDGDPAVRVSALWALFKLKHERTADIAKALTRDSEAIVRENAEKVLQRARRQ